MNNLHFSTFFKRCISSMLFKVRVPQGKLAQRSADQYLILMYHRVVPATAVDATIEPGMYVSAESFADHISFLSRHFTVLPLASLATGSSVSHKKPLCAITFDDGWLDFYHYAFPVLQAFHVPVTVFLPTNFIGTQRAFWTDTVAYILSHKHSLQQSLVGTSQLDDNLIVRHIFRGESYASDDLEQIIGCLKNYRADEIYGALDELTEIWLAIRPANRSFLNWDEVRALRDSGLVTFGSHTANHNLLTTLQSIEVQQELIQSKEKLLAEEVLNHDQPLLFCYPNGNASNEIAVMVQDAGYALAVTTKKGWNEWGGNRFLLNRVGLHEDMSFTKSMFVCRLAGLI